MMRIFIKSESIVKCLKQGYYGVAVNTSPRNDVLLQRGRSMIEMLGVLAIIGVLSVGGIMGYSKAMFRYKINKTIEQITYIAGNIRTTYANQENYQGLNAYCPDNNCIAKKVHIFPEYMWKKGHTRPQHAWENSVYLGKQTKNSADTDKNKAFFIEYWIIPEETCIELLTHDWSAANIKIIQVFDYSYERVPMSIDAAVAVCTEPDDVKGLVFLVDIDEAYAKKLEQKSWANGGY